ncbi:MAG: membrane protein insertase YidC [Holosporaceae bacterium]|jgi:YidC/Oxa1 family membrane protein insertase|nr:membrane protein insertase YidC [Holosporaceae bacterium]
MEENDRNVVIFFVISMLIVIGYPYFFGRVATPPVVQSLGEQFSTLEKRVVSTISPTVQQENVTEIHVESSSISGIISSRGAKIDSIHLKKYRESLDSEENVQVMGNSRSYFAQTGWTSEDHGVILPDENSCWKTDSTVLSEASPVTFTWDNGNGLLFEKRIFIDSDYLITIVDEVKNYGTGSVQLKSVAVISKEVETVEDSLNFYEGPIGYINGKLKEISYEDISKKGEISFHSQGGWFGLTEKYWLTAFIPNQKLHSEVSYMIQQYGEKKICRISIVTANIPAATSVSVSKTHHLFVGAKEITILDDYEKKLGVPHFDLAIDFGFLYLLTKPLLYALALAKNIVGNMGLGILLLTLLIKLLLFPLANKSYRSMNRLGAIQPKIQALQQKYAGDNVRLGQAVSEVYKKEKINPIGGCLPLLLQSPVLFALYKVLYISIEMRQAPFIGWIRDLSQADPLLITNLFGLIPMNLPGFLQVGVCPLLMGISMWFQQKMSPPPGNPQQKTLMWLMPVMFTFLFAQLPSGLIIYWTFSNILGMIQQYSIKRMEEVRGKNRNTEKHSTDMDLER